MAIHQILPNFDYGDAIGNNVRALRRLLREWGHTSEVFAQYVHKRLRNEARYYTQYRAVSDPRNILLFHFSIGSEVTSFFAGLPDRKILVYHNITPAEFFAGINARVADRCRRGRLELRRLAESVDLALGVSEFNRQELEAIGFKRTGVLPILVDWSTYDHPPVPALERTYAGRTALLSVGRIAPNKRIEELIKTFYFYRRLDPTARLIVVGTAVDMEGYLAGCQKLAAELGVADGVVFTGPVSQAELCSYYRLATCYLCLSEHEGFCVPLLEAMHFDLPVIAYASTAVPGILGEAGILLPEKDFPAIAELIQHLLTTPDLRKEILAGQRERLRAFEPSVVGQMLKGYLAELEAR